MKSTLSTIAGVICTMLCLSAGRAAVSVYEPFNYTAGTFNTGTAATGTGLSGNWANGSAGTIVTGITYTGLPVTNNALSSTGSRKMVNFATPLSSGTKYISFLMATSAGNPGGNINGVFFTNSSANCLWFGFGLNPFSGTQGQLGIGSMTTAGTTAVGASSLLQIGLGNYGSTNLIVLKIDFNTSGANDTVTIYTNTTANSATPGLAAAGTNTTFDVGTISGVGLNVQGGTTMTVDEIRVGDTYGDVVGVAAAPNPPTGVTATANNAQVVLNWTASSGATSYNVLRGTSPGTYTVTNTTTPNGYTNTGLANGTTYYYVVQAVGAGGTSANSTPEVSATPNVPPGAPTSLVATPGTNQVGLTWSAGTGTTTSYNVRRSTVSGSGYVLVSTPGAVTTTSFTDTGLAGGVTYYYVVSGSNTVDGANSSEANATPSGVPAAPTGLTITTNYTSLGLSWTAAPGATSYNVKRSTTSGAEVTITNVAGTTFTDSTVLVGTNYFYKVSAVNGDGEGASSSEVSGTAPGAPSAYESFNYSSGTFATGTATTGSGFTGNWTCGASGTINSTSITYPSLPVNNRSLSSTGSRQIAKFANPFGSGTVYIGFLFATSFGNPGGNINGVFLTNSSASCLWFGFGLNPVSGTQGQLGIGSMTTASTAAQTATSLKQIGLGNYGSTNLIVLKIDFNTSGVNDTVTIYTNTTANSPTPGLAAAATNTTFDVGTISGIGLNVQGAATVTVDEIRVGTTYGDAVGYVAPPSAPTGLTAYPGVNSVGLSWTAPSGATGYKVLRGTTSGVYTVTNNVTSATNFDSTTVGGTTYYYVVQATNSTGASANSSEVSATPTIALPNVPTGVTANGSNGFVALSWSAASGAAGYNVKRATSSGAEVTITNITATSFNDANVVNGTPYFYTISATNAAGQSADSSEVTATPNTPPAAPTGLIATPGSNQVSLSWTGSAGAVTYNVKRSTTSGSGYSTIGNTTDPTVSYTDLTAISGTHYYYVVSAVSGYGEGANSSEADATPTGAPQAPTGLAATAGITNISLSWTAAQGAPVSYNVKRSTTSGSGYVTISTGGAVTGTSYTDNSAIPLTNYFYVVSAVNADGESPNSTQASASALPVPSAKLRFAFDDSGTSSVSDTSNGGANVSLNLYAGFGAARANTLSDLHGSTGSGVGTGKALNLTGGTNAACTGPWGANNSSVASMALGSLPRWTASVWFKPTHSPTTERLAILGNNGFCQENQGNGAGAGTLGILLTGTSQITVYLSGNANVSVQANVGTIPVNAWSYVAATYDGANIKVYYGTASNTVSLVATSSTTISNTINFGNPSWAVFGAGDCDGTLSYTGYLDDFRLYSGSGDANFVESVRTAGLATFNTSPVANTDTFTRGSGISMKIAIANLLTNDTDVDIGNTVQFVDHSATTTNSATLTNDGTYIYVPASTVNDAFTYRIHDGAGGTNTGTVLVTLVSQNGQQTTVTPTPSNATAVFFGVPGVSYTIQRATNVTFNGGVSNFPAVTAPSNGVFIVTDDFSDLGAVPGSAFYRLLLP